MHGVYQLNVQPAPYSGNQIQVGAGSFTSTALTLPIPVGTNATNVKGLVEQWYPGSGTQLGFSALPLAGGFDFDLDIAPNAKPFGISASATGEGTAIVASVGINPLLNTWTANYTVPSQNSRNWDCQPRASRLSTSSPGGNFQAASFRSRELILRLLLRFAVRPLCHCEMVEAAFTRVTFFAQGQ